jgi:hypothetical protein
MVAPTQTGLAKGRYVTFRNESGLQPMHFASWGGHADVGRVLISYRAPLMSKSYKDSTAEVTCNGGSSPLHIAALRGNLEFVSFILEEHVKLVASIPSHMEPPEDPRLAQDDYTCTPYVIARNLKRQKVLEVVDPNGPLPTLELIRQRQMLKRSATRAIARRSLTERSDGGSSTEASKRQSLDIQVGHWDPFGTGDPQVTFEPTWPHEGEDNVGGGTAVSVVVVEESDKSKFGSMAKKSNVPKIHPPPLAQLKIRHKVPWLPTLPDERESPSADERPLRVRLTAQGSLVELDIDVSFN